MSFSDLNQQSSSNQYGQNSNQAFGQSGAPGQSAFGGYGSGGMWNQQQRQFTQQDIGEVVRQLAPIIPHILAQAQQHQQQPQAAFGFNQNQRTLSSQDVGEVVRQMLPLLPQILGALAGQNSYGQSNQSGQNYGGFGGGQQNFGGNLPFQSAFGGQGNANWQQRQMGQQDVQELVRQLVSAIPQVIGNLQGLGQRQY